MAITAPTGMLSPAPSISTIMEMIHGQNSMNLWLHHLGAQKEGAVPVPQIMPAAPLAMTNGSADGLYGAVAGQRRDISQVSGGTVDNRAVKRQQV
jgi:hypothetical protein